MARKCLRPWLVSLACLLIVAAAGLAARAQGYQDEYEDEQPVARNQRVRRQQGGGRVQVPQPGAGPPGPPQTPGVNLQGGLETGAMALTSSLDAQPPSVSVGASSQARPPKVTGSGNSPQAQAPQTQPSLAGDQPELVRPMRKKKPRVRPVKKPVYDDGEDEDEEPERRRGSRRDENDDEYCDDDDDDDHDDYGYGHLFRPMRHMKRMMGSVMNQMQGMASNGFGGNFPAGANMAMAQSMSDSDGYSRLSSLVNNNGRTRGIVSETRNGRTQTRRIGGAEDDDDEDEE